MALLGILRACAQWALETLVIALCVAGMVLIGVGVWIAWVVLFIRDSL